YEQLSDGESDSSKKTNDFTIQVGAAFSNWKSLEQALKKYEAKIGFKAIKFRMEWHRKDSDSIIINKLVENHNYSLALYQKEFAPSLRALLQEVLDEIKFLTQEYGLGAKVQYQYITKKFQDQPLFDRDLYNAIRQYKNQIGN
ncbi:43703_t:CDS:2, partial [Gigaspora margarita]